MSAHLVTSLVPTDQGDARLTTFKAKHPRARLALGHGFGGGIHARDLQAVASVLPGTGIEVVLVEQPWVVAGKKLAPATGKLDTAWNQIVETFNRDLPLFVGGRSAGARVACRTATTNVVAGVVALAFPLHAPGKTEPTRRDELLLPKVPVLVVQGTRDTFGTYYELRKAAARHKNITVSKIEGADHSFAVTKASGIPQEESDLEVARVVAHFLTPDGVAGL